MGAGKRFSSLIQSDLQMSGRRIPGFMFVRGLRMDFWGKLAARRARRPKIVSTVVPERTFKRSIEPPPNDYGVSYLARILETD